MIICWSRAVFAANKSQRKWMDTGRATSAENRRKSAMTATRSQDMSRLLNEYVSRLTDKGYDCGFSVTMKGKFALLRQNGQFHLQIFSSWPQQEPDAFED